MTHDFQFDEQVRRSNLLFRPGWEGVVFFAGLAACLAIVLIGQNVWT